MKVTERLQEEHEAIKLMLSILGKVCVKLDSGKPMNSEHLNQILEFIKIFTDKCHHGKEEEVLYPTMEKAGILRDGGPIGIMLMEHDIGRDYVKGMSEAITRYIAGEQKFSAQIVENARNYIDLLAEHIDKENNILYPLGEMHIPEKTKPELLREFDKIETERIGAGKHEQLHELLHHLKEAI